MDLTQTANELKELAKKNPIAVDNLELYMSKLRESNPENQTRIVELDGRRLRVLCTLDHFVSMKKACFHISISSEDRHPITDDLVNEIAEIFLSEKRTKVPSLMWPGLVHQFIGPAFDFTEPANDDRTTTR